MKLNKKIEKAKNTKIYQKNENSKEPAKLPLENQNSKTYY